MIGDNEKGRRLAEIAQKFQRDMTKLGLGVSMQAGDGPAVQITTYCEKPGHGVTLGAVCSKCGESA